MNTENVNQTLISKNKLKGSKSKNKLIVKDIIEENEKLEKINLVEIVNNLLEEYKTKELANILNLAPGTLTRWIELNDVPKNYEFDLLKLSKIKIDYSKYSTKEKDQFFTPTNTVKLCYDILCNTLKKYNEKIEDFNFIEPSAGDGSFLKILPKEKTIGLDIEPLHENIIEMDYLDWEPSEAKRYIVIGNPPFGLRGHQALKFINHSYEFAEYVAFILPQLFESDGKGVPRKRVKGYNLICTEKLETNFYEPNNNVLKVNTIFQIWSKNHKNEDLELKDYTNDEMKVYSLSDGGTVSTTRNKDMIGVCDVYIPSTCFGKENMICYDDFEKLPGRKGYGVVFEKNKKQMIEKMKKQNWSDIAFLSTNSAYNLRSSQIYLALYEKNK